MSHFSAIAPYYRPLLHCIPNKREMYFCEMYSTFVSSKLCEFISTVMECLPNCQELCMPLFMSFCNLCLLAVVGLLGRREVSIKDLLNNVLWSSPWQPIEETKVNALGLKQFVKHYSSWVIPRLWEATLSALGQSWNPT